MLHKKVNFVLVSFSLFLGLSVSLSLKSFSQSEKKDLAYNAENPVFARLHSDPVQVSISQSDSSDLKFRVYIINPEEQKVTIYIRSKALGTLFTKTLTEGEFSNHEYANLYNMNELEDGQYSIEVVAGKDSIRKEIVINTTTRIDRKASIN